MKLAIVNLSLLLATAVPGADLPELWQARLRSVVAVDYTVASEIAPHVVTSFGVAVDRQGTVVLPLEAVDPAVPVKQLQHFQVYLAGETDGHDATYLGSSAYWGFQYLRTDEATAARLVPITDWGRRWRVRAGTFIGYSPGTIPPDPALPQIGEAVWGIALRSKEEAFAPYLLMSHVALVEQLPGQTVGITQEAAAGPGMPVFDEQGNWIGLASSSFGQDYLEYSRERPQGEPVMLLNLEESSAFIRSANCVVGFSQLPKSPDSRPIAWIGSLGLEPSAEGGLDVGEVGADSPAERAGLRGGDRILSVRGSALRPEVPLSLEVSHFQRLIAQARPGDPLPLVVLRNGMKVPLTVVVADAPTLVREARRRYFAAAGVVIREPVAADGYGEGAIVVEVAPEGPAAQAGLRARDRIVKINGAAAGDFFATAGRLETGEGNVRLGVKRPGEYAPITLHVHWTR